MFHNNRQPYIDVRKPSEDLTDLVEIGDDEPFILHPGKFVLRPTVERVAIPDDLVARLEGKSSLGRLGLLIHSTAGYIDPGWDGYITLELVERRAPAHHDLCRDEDRAALLPAAHHPDRSAVYQGKYQGQRGPTATSTRTGLEVYAQLDKRTYPDKVRITDAELAAASLHRAPFHPEWNYTIKPRT